MIGLGLIWHVDLLLPVVEATTQLKVHKEMFGIGNYYAVLKGKYSLIDSLGSVCAFPRGTSC